MPIAVMDVMQHFAETRGQTMKILIAGPPGSGKTRFASTFPNVVYADAEGHLLSVRDRPVRAVPIETIKDLEDLRSELDQRPDIRAKRLGGPVDTVVVDTVDHVARLMIRERLKAERKETFAQADWGIHGDRLRDILRGFRNLSDLNVIFNVHIRSERDEESGRVSYKPAIQGAVGGEIGEYTDECFLLVRRTVTDPATGDRRVTRFLQTYADSQHDWLKDHSGSLPMEFPIDFETDYERLAKAVFGNAVPAPQRSVRVQEIADWQPTETDLIDANAPDAPVVEESTSEAPTKPAKRPAKKRARSQLDTSDGLLQGDAPQGDVVGEPSELPDQATHPDTAVPETGTETAPPVTEPTATPAAPDSDQKVCAVCGTADINEDYLELSEARWGEYLCRSHFLERNKQK